MDYHLYNCIHILPSSKPLRPQAKVLKRVLCINLVKFAVKYLNTWQRKSLLNGASSKQSYRLLLFNFY